MHMRASRGSLALGLLTCIGCAAVLPRPLTAQATNNRSSSDGNPEKDDKNGNTSTVGDYARGMSSATERVAADPALAAAAKKTWGDKPVLWSITGNYEPYEYVTGYGDVDENGELLPPDTPTGFAVEMISRTCDLCGLKCEWVIEDTQNCWSSAGFPGVGLQAGYFDACNAFTNTARRQLGVDFSDSIALPRAAGILTRLDEDGKPVVSPSSDLSDVVVAIVGGWATNGRSIGYATNECTGDKFNASPVDGYITLTANDPYGGPDAAMAALLSGEADALYTYTGIVEDRQGCTQQGCNASLYDGLGTEYAWIHEGIYDYQLNGTTLAMTKKGSTLSEAINPCVQKAMRSEFYAELCEKYNRLGFNDIECYANEFLPKDEDDEAVEEGEEDEDGGGTEGVAPAPAPSGSRGGDCSSGYCGCPAEK